MSVTAEQVKEVVGQYAMERYPSWRVSLITMRLGGIFSDEDETLIVHRDDIIPRAGPILVQDQPSTS